MKDSLRCRQIHSWWWLCDNHVVSSGYIYDSLNEQRVVYKSKVLTHLRRVDFPAPRKPQMIVRGTRDWLTDSSTNESWSIKVLGKMSKTGLLMNDLWKDPRDVVVRIRHHWGWDDDIRGSVSVTRNGAQLLLLNLGLVDPLSHFREICHQWLPIVPLWLRRNVDRSCKVQETLNGGRSYVYLRSTTKWLMQWRLIDLGMKCVVNARKSFLDSY